MRSSFWLRVCFSGFLLIAGLSPEPLTAATKNTTLLAEALNRAGADKYARGDIEGALVDFTKAIELDPGLPEAYRNRGMMRMVKKDRNGALADFNKAIELNPRYLGAYNSRGFVEASEGNTKDALADFSRAIELNPRDPSAYNNRGIVLINKGDIEGALADYRKAIALNPRDAWSYLNRGVALAVQEKWRKADADFDTSLRLDSTCIYAGFYRFMAQMRLGQAAEAKKNLAEALRKRRGARPDDWPSHIGAFLLGQESEADLLKHAEAKEAETTRKQRCAAWFYAGLARLTTGEKDAAAICFRKCLLTGEKDFWECTLASAELGRPEGKK